MLFCFLVWVSGNKLSRVVVFVVVCEKLTVYKTLKKGKAFVWLAFRGQEGVVVAPALCSQCPYAGILKLGFITWGLNSLNF